MTDDFIQEMQEEQRRERLEHVLRRFGAVAAVFVVLALAGGGIWFWQHHTLMKAEGKASQRYFAALRLLSPSSEKELVRQSDRKEAESILDSLSSTAPAGIRAYARMRLADLKKEEGDDQKALALWSEVKSDKKAESALKDMAQYLSLNAQTGKIPDSDLRKGYDSLIQKGGAFSSLAREGIVALDLGPNNTADQRKEAKRLLIEIQTSADSTDALRQRAGLLLRIIGDVK